jgi:Protein of unknown function (DUF2877)
VRICAIGWRAHAALCAGGEARVLAALTASTYIDVAGEVLWIGETAAASHARAVHVAVTLDGVAAGDVLRVPAAGALEPWRPGPGPTSSSAAAALRRGATRLVVRMGPLGPPRGFGAWLLGAPLQFPLQTAGARADALAHACAADDPARAIEAARALIGLGPGLTPAGDDLTGGAFFARALLAHAGVVDAAAWRQAAAEVRAAAARLTHPIGVALLGDLLLGEGWAPLHELAETLVHNDDSAALQAAARLTRLGHSSGWDLLAGFIIGARG